MKTLSYTFFVLIGLFALGSVAPSEAASNNNNNGGAPAPTSVNVFNGDRNAFYTYLRPDYPTNNSGISSSDPAGTAHGYPAYATNVASPTGKRGCYLIDPTSWPAGWSLGGYNSSGNNSMLAWNGSKWYKGSAGSFGNKRYTWMTCATNALADTSLTASATNITAGESVTLNWLSEWGKIRQASCSATNFSMSTGGSPAILGETICIDLGMWGGSFCFDTGIPASPGVERPFGGSTSVSPTVTTTYTYACTNANGTSQKSVTVNVGPAGIQCADGIDNDADGLIDFGSDPGCSSAADTTEADIAPQCADGIDNDGDSQVDSADSGCSNDADNTEASGTEPVARLSASPSIIGIGLMSTLTWSSDNATSCTGTGFNTGGAPSGSVSTGILTVLTNYSVNCGGAVANATVGINNPTGSITATPERVNAGDSVSLSWETVGATACTVTGTNGFSSSALNSTGTSSGAITTKTTFTLSCDSGALNKTAVVNVIPRFQEF